MGSAEWNDADVASFEEALATDADGWVVLGLFGAPGALYKLFAGHGREWWCFEDVASRPHFDPLAHQRRVEQRGLAADSVRGTPAALRGLRAERDCPALAHALELLEPTTKRRVRRHALAS